MSLIIGRGDGCFVGNVPGVRHEVAAPADANHNLLRSRLSQAESAAYSGLTTMLDQMLKSLSRLTRDESGAAIAEYAIVTGLVIVAVVAIISVVGPKAMAR